MLIGFMAFVCPPLYGLIASVGMHPVNFPGIYSP
nr:MAG TPA: hypothetical protein [Caudoviricetes sp.]